ncbi:MAG: AAA family ATPase [Nocardioides sp.]
MAVVLMVASGADWESAALAALDTRRAMVVLRRCVDVDDLLAAASTGQADVAVLGVDTPGLDADAVQSLRHLGVEPVLVVPTGFHLEPARERAHRLAVAAILGQGEIGDLPDAVERAAADAQPEVSSPSDPAASSADPTGRVVTVWGPAGAPGRSTVAVALASTWASRGVSTLLVDADPYGGVVGQMLGIVDEVAGVLAANRSMQSGLRSLGPHLNVVTGLPRADRWTELHHGLIDQIVGGWDSVVVLDTGFCLEVSADEFGRPGRNQLTLDAIDAADDLVVVGAADPIGLARLARGLVELGETAAGQHVVVNRMRPQLGWTQAQITAMLVQVVGGREITFLPEDGASLDRAGIAGRSPVEVAPDSTFSRAIAGLCDRVITPTEPASGVRWRRAGRSLSR